MDGEEAVGHGLTFAKLRRSQGHAGREGGHAKNPGDGKSRRRGLARANT